MKSASVTSPFTSAFAAQKKRLFAAVAAFPGLRLAGSIHGFTSADDYYARSSSLQFLSRITTPTLILNAEDDPFLPREALERARAAASPAIEFRTTQCGGHTGFISGTFPWRCEYWAEERIVEWLIGRV